MLNFKLERPLYPHLQLARKYLHYYLTASNGKGHGIHSPFVFDFIIHVLNDKHAYPEYASIEGLRRQLLQDKTMLEIEDMGAGSVTEAAGMKGIGVEGPRAGETNWTIRRRSVAEITRHAAKPKKLGQLLFRIARYYRPGNILELGTSLGLSTAYLAAGRREAKVISIEGAPAVAAVAAKNLQSLGSDNVDLITGNFDDVLRSSLSGKPADQGKYPGPDAPVFDLAFVDGNHREEPTLRYFNWLAERAAPSAMLIFDDIHWSREMENAWSKIQNDPRVLLTVDLFFLGLVVFRDEFKVKQHFVIRY